MPARPCSFVWLKAGGCPMSELVQAYAALARLICIVAGWALMAIAIAATIEVFSRKYLNYSFQGIDEIGGYMMAAVSAVGFGYALTTRSHMRVTLLFPYIPSWLQAVLNVIAMLTLAAMAVFCAYRGVFELIDSTTTLKRSNTPLQVPLWIPQSFWLIGMLLFAAGTILTAIDAVRLLFSNASLLNRRYGPQSIEEEISTEVSHAEAREGISSRAPNP